jgi:hypothetical protein
MSRPGAARTRYYVDADLLGLAKVLVQIRSDVTYPGDPGGLCPDQRLRPPCVITAAATLDADWLPVVAGSGLIVITKDSAIGRTPRLRDLVNEHGSRLVAIAARGKMRTWDHLVVVASVWDRMDELIGAPGPWMYRATRGRLTKVAEIS